MIDTCNFFEVFLYPIYYHIMYYMCLCTTILFEFYFVIFEILTHLKLRFRLTRLIFRFCLTKWRGYEQFLPKYKYLKIYLLLTLKLNIIQNRMIKNIRIHLLGENSYFDICCSCIWDHHKYLISHPIPKVPFLLSYIWICFCGCNVSK